LRCEATVRPGGSRKKKLIAALHFQFSNQSGWECAPCRKAGLETKRRCGWIPRALETSERVVWARNGAATTICPKSFITAQSMAWVEEYLVRRKLGHRGIEGLGARDVEAFLILEHELNEVNHGAGAGRQNSGSRARVRNG
jgi:hypothetical protein